MKRNKKPQNRSTFARLGLKETIATLTNEIKELYQLDHAPWIVGYSGGKDSTAALQLVWAAIRDLPKDKRSKTIHVISTDTLVENPIVVKWVDDSLAAMDVQAKKESLPIITNRLTPRVEDSFWVNLIGRGYPSPRHKFRWCTHRLKIKPSNEFISDLIRQHGSSILVLGIRKAESSSRSHAMTRLESKRVRDRLSPNANLPNCEIYSPLENWSNDDVWMFLMKHENPWAYDNHQLLNMYKGASADGECPLVIDTSTPSCGSSRFGCWVCTLVDKDLSMQAMIQNDSEKDWMMPLLELRDRLAIKDDRHLRDFRRLRGNVQLFYDRPIPGPYKQSAREYWLREVLEAQQFAQENAPGDMGKIEIISLPELREIRRLWITEKHEIEDSLPRIYEDVTREPFPDDHLDDNQVFGLEEINLLKDVTLGDELHFELIRELLHVEWSYRTKVHRAGLFESLEQGFRRSFYDNPEDATDRSRRLQESLKAAKDGRYNQQAFTFSKTHRKSTTS